MKKTTVNKLNQINKKFYKQISGDFSRTRQSGWAGWDRLFGLIKDMKGMSVLDVGCGNGRFGKFLQENFTGEFSYVGIDSNQALLEEAEKSLVSLESCRLIRADVLEGEEMENLRSDSFDLIVVFGVMHHVPSHDLRERLINLWVSKLNDSGILVLSFWRFERNARFKSKTVEWKNTGYADLKPDLEEGDSLLTWNNNVDYLRYCHKFSDVEIENYSQGSGLKLLDSFQADGSSGDLNTYLVLGKPQAS